MTLTEASFWTKRLGVIALGALIIVVIIILVIVMNSNIEVVMPQYLEPNFACTQHKEEFLENRLQIPSLQFADGTELSFDIKTDTGKIDSLPEIINVYKFNNRSQSLTAQADAKILAKAMGFDPDVIERVSTQGYKWTDRAAGRTLEVEAKNLNFTLKTDTSVMRESSASSALPSEQEAKSIAVNALNSLGVFPSDYTSGNHRTTLININPDGSFSKAHSLAEADLIRVDLIRIKSMITIPSNIENAEKMVRDFSRRTLIEPTEETSTATDGRLGIFTFNTLVSFPQTQRANISVYVGPAITGVPTRVSKIYQIDYTYRPIAAEACGTYKLVDPEYATEMIQQGEGSLVYLSNTGADDVVDYMPKAVKKFIILDIFIVYFEDREELEYLQPVYLISGEAIFHDDTKGTFDFFYPAINYNIVQDKIEMKAPEVVDTSSSPTMFF